MHSTANMTTRGRVADSAGTSDTFPSGDGEAGGEFRFRFTNLSADFNHSNNVDVGDLAILGSHNGMTSASQSDGDASGNGVVEGNSGGADLVLYQAQKIPPITISRNRPSIEPGMILVSTTVDESDGDYTLGDLSLRGSVAIAATQSGPDTIQFAPSLFGSGAATITLGSAGQLLLGSEVTIAGPGANLLTINRSGTTGRIFQVNSGVTATISDVKLSGGNGVAQGGAIYVDGTLHLESSVVQGNSSTSNGGGLFVNGNAWLEVVDSTIDNNQSPYGGGIFMYVGEGERLKILEAQSRTTRRQRAEQVVALICLGPIPVLLGSPRLSTVRSRTTNALERWNSGRLQQDGCKSCQFDHRAEFGYLHWRRSGFDRLSHRHSRQHHRCRQCGWYGQHE